MWALKAAQHATVLQPRKAAIRYAIGRTGSYAAHLESFLPTKAAIRIVSASKVYAIYWDPTDHYHGDWQHVIDIFLQSMGAASGTLGNVFAVDAQYTDKANQHSLFKSTFHESLHGHRPAILVSACEDPDPFETLEI